MCGITGAIWTDPARGIDEATLEKMTSVLRHRGPDDGGRFTSEFRRRPPYGATPGVALGFRRLSVIDIDGGRQPMSNEDGSVWVVCNGEIYNYPSLRRRLQGAGHTFRTESDTETLVHLYEDEGLNAFQHLNGMFAVAIWDASQRRLILARDRFGQKPLVYRAEPDRLLFSSELKSLLAVGDVPREVDPDAIDEYLAHQYIPHPNTIFRGIQKLPPGHLAVFQDGEVRLQAWWQLDCNREVPTAAGEAAERLRELLDSSVQLRMRSDVPVGTFLSGGVDSSLIATIMQRGGAEPIRTFSIDSADPQYDESKWSRLVAGHIGSTHESREVSADVVGLLSKLVWHFDEPFADSSAVPTWCVSELARRHVTVALTGDGGDELFAGYSRYKAVRLAACLDRVGLSRLCGANWWQKLAGRGRRTSLIRRIKRFAQPMRLSPLRRYQDWIAIFQEGQRADLYRDDFLESLSDDDPCEFLAAAWRRADHRDPVTAMCLTDLVTYLPCDLMNKVDIASMAHSLECRQPFLDHRVVEFAASLPIELKMHQGRGKRLLQLAYADDLPREIWRRPKMGFGVPVDRWFRYDLRELTRETLLSDGACCHAWFQRDAIERLVADHESAAFDHADRLWSLLVLELWLQEWTS